MSQRIPVKSALLIRVESFGFANVEQVCNLMGKTSAGKQILSRQTLENYREKKPILFNAILIGAEALRKTKG